MVKYLFALFISVTATFTASGYAASDSIANLPVNLINDSIQVTPINVADSIAPLINDSISLTPEDIIISQESSVTAPDSVVTKKRGNIIQRILTYFKHSNEPNYKKFDSSVIGAPYYNSDTGFGIAAVWSGFYRRDTTDRITPPSNFSLYATVSTTGFFMVGIKGHQIFKHDIQRIDYDVYFWRNPKYFWGVGYDDGINNANCTKYMETFVHAWATYIRRFYHGLFAGAGFEFKYANSRPMKGAGKTLEEAQQFWNPYPLITTSFGLGVKLQYDTRDNFTATTKGILASVEQKFFPRFMGNNYAFSSTDFRFNFYTKMWKGSVLAGQYRLALSYGNVPWVMLPTFGGSYSMRGYYEGRYHDKCETDFTLEYRQHLWRRNGMVIWGGVGSVFPKLSKFDIHHLLPCYGIGYRWELKHQSNVRVDVGFGRKGEYNLTFSINEAF
ncbi:MAG: BamA/TamA family outer membrane protein [Paramuribaculum sp.]|nr:BamA/TamA family outer membrane protein [Paramuribaculum sp.]